MHDTIFGVITDCLGELDFCQTGFRACLDGSILKNMLANWMILRLDRGMTYNPKFSPVAFLVWLCLTIALIFGYTSGPDAMFQSIALVILFGNICVGVFLLAPLLGRPDH